MKEEYEECWTSQICQELFGDTYGKILLKRMFEELRYSGTD
jgi:hypothetical protein